MERPRPSSIAWGAVIGGVFIYDALCPPGEQLSERADEWMEHPVKRRLLELGMGAVALHVCNHISPKYDAIHRIATIRRKR